MNRKEILAAAGKCVCCDREETYGDPRDNFLMVSQLWENYMRGGCISPDAELCINPEDVAAMTMLLKSARISTGNGTLDNWIDCAGYAALGGEIQHGIQDGLKAGESSPMVIDVIPGDFMEVHHKGHTATLAFMPQGQVVGYTELGDITSVLHGKDLNEALNDFRESVDCWLEQQDKAHGE